MRPSCSSFASGSFDIDVIFHVHCTKPVWCVTAGVVEMAGGGGNRAWARTSLFSSLVDAWMIRPSGPVLHSMGMRVLPLSPPGLDMYLCAIQMSVPAMSLSHSFQCSSFVLCISLLMRFSFSRSVACASWFGSALKLYACLRKCLSSSDILVRSLVHHLFVCGVSQSVDLGQNNNPNTTPTKDYENV